MQKPYRSKVVVDVTHQGMYHLDTGHKLNAHKTIGRRSGCLLNILCTSHLPLVSTGSIKTEIGAGLVSINFPFLKKISSKFLSKSHFQDFICVLKKMKNLKFSELMKI